MTLYILNYNNYYNRLVKREETISDYQPYIFYVLSETNFNPNDNIDTQHIFGDITNQYDGSGDYCLAVDETGDIVSRWFLIESARTRNGQWQVTLHRDVVADYKELLIQSPVFIEKASLDDADPFIFNSEDMTFNQIKKSETLLKDETDCAWIVGYMSSKPFEIDKQAQDKISSKISFHLPVDATYPSLSAYDYYQYSDQYFPTNPLIGNPTNLTYCVWVRDSEVVSGGATGYKFAFNAAGKQPTGVLGTTGVSSQVNHLWFSSDTWEENFQCPQGEGGGGSMIWENSLYATKEPLKINQMLDYFIRGFSVKDSNGLTHFAKIKNLLHTIIPVSTTQQTEELLKENGKVIYVEDTKKYYRVSINNLGLTQTEIKPGAGSAYQAFVNAYNSTVNVYANDPYYSFEETWSEFTGITAAPNTFSFSLNLTAQRYQVVLTEQEQPALNYEIQIDNERYHLNDAPYDMFCIPYSDTLVINKNGTPLVTASKELAFQTAMALGRDYTAAGYIYDLQLLPYCPVRQCIQSDGTFDIKGYSQYYIRSYTEDKTYDQGTIVGVVLFASSSSFTVNIPCEIEITNKKIQAQCDMWRLCSPNYSGLFEFNVAKNDGVDFINVDCTYKPYNPYLHLNPNFKNLYGQDFNDARGLICGGDFSLPNVTDAWKTYELTNKNYQNTFDRQIQSMELKNNIQKTQDIVNAATGTISGAASGAVAGAAAGPWGVLAGGIVGGVGSLVGGIADVSVNELLRNDALDLTKDLFGYQLGNIQALPYSLSKTSAYTYNNKYFPFIEYYTCTDQEKQALESKLKYNGMTVMRIGKMEDYIQQNPTYIKGKLIRLEGVNEDYHIVNTIAGELNKGVYI